MSTISTLVDSWRRCRSDSRADTVIALIQVALVLGPFIYAIWKVHRGRKSASSSALPG